MKKKFLALLKSKNTHVGVSDKAFDRVASFYEKNGLLKEESTDEELTTLAEGAETLLIGMKAESDSKLEDYKKKNNSQQSQEAEKKEGADDKKSESEKKDASRSEQPDIAKLIADALKPITEKITGLETAKQHESLNDKLVKALADKKIPKTYYSNAIAGRQFKDDSEVEELVSSLETDYNDLKKEFSQEGLGQAGKPVIGGSSSDKTKVEQDIKSWAASKNPPPTTTVSK